MPKLAHGYVEYLVSHETCHQWWYNLVGTNGYSETFMDEGPATYFTHRLLDIRHGKNNRFLNWPEGFDWLAEHSPGELPLREHDRGDPAGRGAAGGGRFADVRAPVRPVHGGV